VRLKVDNSQFNLPHQNVKRKEVKMQNWHSVSVATGRIYATHAMHLKLLDGRLYCFGRACLRLGCSAYID